MKINPSIFWFQKPTNKIIQNFLDSQINEPFSYAEVGTTKTTPPDGYQIDHHRIQLGSGIKTFEMGKKLLQSWKMFHLKWVELYPQHVPFYVGQVVVPLIHNLGIWFMNASRVVYLIETNGPVEKFSFAYGILPAHFEKGEERFTIEWNHQDDSVWYDILAFSKPNHMLSKLAYPYVRRLQKKFAHDSMQAMLQAVK